MSKTRFFTWNEVRVTENNGRSKSRNSVSHGHTGGGIGGCVQKWRLKQNSKQNGWMNFKLVMRYNLIYSEHTLIVSVNATGNPQCQFVTFCTFCCACTCTCPSKMYCYHESNINSNCALTWIEFSTSIYLCNWITFKVLVVASHQIEMYQQPVEWFFHRNEHIENTFVTISAASNKTLSLTKHHLLPLVPCFSKRMNLVDLDEYVNHDSVFAFKAKPGLCLATKSEPHLYFESDIIVDVKYNIKRGVSCNSSWYFNRQQHSIFVLQYGRGPLFTV